MEAEAVVEIISYCESGRAVLASSDALDFERQNPHPVRKAHALGILTKATRVIPVSIEIEQRAAAFIQAGLKALNSLHMACAAVAESDYFCTCDDRLLKKSRNTDTMSTKVVSPLELILELGL